MPQEFREIPLDSLELDPNNPRLPKSLHGKSEAEIISYMLLDASLVELMLAIGVNGFFAGEQLLVVPTTQGKFKVIEGNRRLSAVKLLNNPELAEIQKVKINQVLEETTHRPTNLPCLIFDSEQEIHSYLGYRHITGIKEWKLLEKAKYLYDLFLTNYTNQSIDEASKELAKSIGSRKDYVKRLLVGYQIFEKIEDNSFFRIRDVDDTTFHFNYIADSLNKPNIRTFLNVSIDSDATAEQLSLPNLEKWTKWLFEKNDQNKTRMIGDSYDLTSLNAILGVPEAFEAFDQKGYTLSEAEELTNLVDEQFISFLNKALKNLEQADRLVGRIKSDSIEITEEIRNIRITASKILRTIEEKQEDI